MPMNIRWFLSKTVRQATEMRRQVQKLLNHQRDLLGSTAVAGLCDAMAAMQSAVDSGAGREALKSQMVELEKAANKWLKPYPSASIRENIEVFLVAIAVAVGIRTFFLQPFKIPTGSMQPTLYGVTHDYLAPDEEIPRGLKRKWEYWTSGVAYVRETVKVDGRLERVLPPVKFLLFNLKQDYYIGGQKHTVWFPDDRLFQRAGLVNEAGRIQDELFRAGDRIFNLKVHSGDHLFVDRLTYNFRMPERGDIIVFATAGTQIPQQDQFYIKRLVALGGESVQIGDDQHVVIDGRRLDASTPHFENVYTFSGPPKNDGDYFGHVNNGTALRMLGSPIARYFPDGEYIYEVPDDAYLAFGDNTLNSSDSRYWGPIPKENVIGKSFFVYWPITSRFGWGHR
ncbi:MAG TPA: signal peptidase I [Verrucomicrobiales bacterium]|nr:signal peptidase I [Verrucomicrobiales bacterium]